MEVLNYGFCGVFTSTKQIMFLVFSVCKQDNLKVVKWDWLNFQSMLVMAHGGSDGDMMALSDRAVFHQTVLKGFWWLYQWMLVREQGRWDWILIWIWIQDYFNDL